MERKAVIQLLVICCYFLLCQGRLTEKSLEKIKTTPEPDLVKSTLYQRIARKAIEVTAVVSEESGTSEENIENQSKSIRHITNQDIIANKSVASGRVARYSDDHHYNEYDKTISTPDRTREKKVLVKKPIPKFYELDYTNDFQNAVAKLSPKVMDSLGDHEDEDFNLGDYDFDINHDEFVGRGKPLEPRLKKIENKALAELIRQEEETHPTPAAPPVIPTEKVIINPKMKNVKREYPRRATYKPNMKTDDDYSDEISTSTAKNSQTDYKLYDDISDEGFDKENDNKVRMVRSPGFIDDFLAGYGKKTVSFAGPILPFFLTRPGEVALNEDMMLSDINDPLIDPMTGKRPFVF